MTLSAVWQHLDADGRRLAMPRLRAFTARSGRLLLSVRHGPGAPTRPCFPAPVEETIDLARANGLRLLLDRSVDSLQAGNRRAGVTWSWLVFAPAGRGRGRG